MSLKRVVITGIGVVSPFGNGLPALMKGIEEGRSAVRRMEGWEQYIGLHSLVGAPVEMRDEKRIPRQKRRSMGRMSIFAAQAADEALADAGISLVSEDLWRIGCVIGSTMGSAKSINDAFETMLPNKDLSRLNSTMFFQCMSHTAAVNVAQYLGLNGTIMAPAAACASALHAIGTGYDLIRLGRQDVLLCGGAEELHPTVTGSFDILFATSTKYNDTPQKTPRPFDKDRDGLVCGEGSGLLVLEDYERAIRRNAKIYAEIIGLQHHGERASREPVEQGVHGRLYAAGAQRRRGKVRRRRLYQCPCHGDSPGGPGGGRGHRGGLRFLGACQQPEGVYRPYTRRFGRHRAGRLVIYDEAGRDLPDLEPGYGRS